MTAVLIHRHLYIRKLAFYLVRFVAQILHTALIICQHKAPAPSLVASAEHCHLELVFEQLHQILHVRCLACASHSDIAHRDHWHIKASAFQYPYIEEHVSEFNADAIEEAQGQQRLVDLYKIAFHNDVWWCDCRIISS